MKGKGLQNEDLRNMEMRTKTTTWGVKH